LPVLYTHHVEKFSKCYLSVEGSMTNEGLPHYFQSMIH